MKDIGVANVIIGIVRWLKRSMKLLHLSQLICCYGHKTLSEEEMEENNKTEVNNMTHTSISSKYIHDESKDKADEGIFC